MGNGIDGLGSGASVNADATAANDTTATPTGEPSVSGDGERPQGKSPPADGMERTTQPATQQPPADSRAGFLSALNPSRLFGSSKAAPNTPGRQQEPPAEKGSFLAGLVDNVRSGAEKLGQLNELLNNPFVKHGLEVLRQSGLNGMQLGAQVQRDIDNGTIPADMVARLKSGSYRTGDVAFLLGYMRDLAGGTLTLKLDNDAARELFQEVPLPPEIKAGTVRELQLGPGDELILRFSGEPLYDAGAVSADFGKELRLTISGIGDANATRLTFEGESGTSTEMLFTGLNLELTDNKTIDGMLSFFCKILLAPFLLIASLWGEATGSRVELEDGDDGQLRVQAEAFGVTLAGDSGVDEELVEEKRQQQKDRAREGER